MKTPEDIKKGLECHADRTERFLPCSECAYHGQYLPPCGIDVPEKALAYIKKLEERIAKQDALLAVMGITIPEDKNDENP